MAKLGVFYGLCPLIDQRSLLGVTCDESLGYAIVTLGKNIAIKYKLSDQKQIHSWSTKEGLSSPVVFDKNAQQYVAVFNNNAIRMFGSDCEILDRIKKYKFQAQIHTLFSSEDGQSWVLFKNGTVSSLSYALDKRKEEPREAILEDGDQIETHSCLTFHGTVAVGMLIRCGDRTQKFVLVQILENGMTEDRNFIVSMKLVRAQFELTGHLLMAGDDCLELLTLWSDSRLYTVPMQSDAEFPGRMISSLEALCCTQQVSIIALNSLYIAMYGSDKTQEGANLIIYNIQFHVPQSKVPFKLFNVGATLHLINGNILLAVGNHLAVVPFNLATEQLAALVGSHRLVNSTNDDVQIISNVEVANWNCVEPIRIIDLPECISKPIQKKYKNMINEGYSEGAICEEILPNLIQQGDISVVVAAVQFFSHIPERVIINLLNLAVTSMRLDEETLQPVGANQLMDMIIGLSFNDVLLLPYLRTELNFSQTLMVLHYICTLLDDESWSSKNVDTIKLQHKIIEWASLVLDAHYHKFLLSRDSQVIELLKRFQALVNTQISCVNEYKQILPTLDLINQGKNISSSQFRTSKWYSIEKMSLY